MKTFLVILILSVPGIFNVYSQSCVLSRVPSSAGLPQSGGTTYSFSIINMNTSCTPVFSVSHSWLTYRYERSSSGDRGLLYITGTANSGPPRTGYVYVDNKESMKITITQAGSHVYVTGVSVSPASALLSVNEEKYLTATVSPSNATNKSLTWTSSNTTIATVDSYGKVTARTSSGKATITAKSVENPNIKSSSVITVTTMPKNFSWANYITPVKDQETGGPCFAFAAIGAVEAKYKIQHQTTTDINLSEGQLNFECLNTYLSIPNVLTFIKDNGVVDEDCYPYALSPFLGGPTPSDCYSPCGNNYALKVYVNNFTCIDLSTINANSRADYFKNTIKNNGTIAVSFDGTSLHSGQMHAYEIYGWEESVWLYKDSWQGQAGYKKTSIDIPAILASNASFKACYIGSVSEVFPSGRQGSEFPSTFAKNEPEPVNDVQDNQNHIDIYPNPAGEKITIAGSPESAGFVQIFKINGSLVFSEMVNDNQIDISKLAPGTYFIKLTVKRERKTFRFVKL